MCGNRRYWNDGKIGPPSASISFAIAVGMVSEHQFNVHERVETEGKVDALVRDHFQRFAVILVEAGIPMVAESFLAFRDAVGL